MSRTHERDSINRWDAISMLEDDENIINAMDSVPDGEMRRTKRACVRILMGMPSMQPEWIPCSKKMPPDFQWCYATCKSLVDNRENWVIDWCYIPGEHFNSIPMIRYGDAEVIAWMPRPKPYQEES